jgi:hypothetical protein
MNENTNSKQHKGGRKPKVNPSAHRYVFRLNDEENAKFLTLFEQSGVDNKAKFIVSVLFRREIKTVKIDKATMEFYMRLTHFYGQFRAVGTNYNQIVKMLYSHFSEKKAAAYLFKLEKQTAEMVVLCQKIIALTQEFEQKHLSKTV